MGKKHIPVNPKDIQATRKVALGLLPAAGKIYGALAMAQGAAKYGPYNWRDSKVLTTVYLDAIERHLEAIYDGEWCAKDSNVPHLGHIIAGAAIILDANGVGNLVNDLPPPGPAAAILAKHEKPRKKK